MFHFLNFLAESSRISDNKTSIIIAKKSSILEEPQIKVDTSSKFYRVKIQNAENFNLGLMALGSIFLFEYNSNNAKNIIDLGFDEDYRIVKFRKHPCIIIKYRENYSEFVDILSRDECDAVTGLKSYLQTYKIYRESYKIYEFSVDLSHQMIKDLHMKYLESVVRDETSLAFNKENAAEEGLIQLPAEKGSFHEKHSGLSKSTHIKDLASMEVENSNFKRELRDVGLHPNDTVHSKAPSSGSSRGTKSIEQIDISKVIENQVENSERDKKPTESPELSFKDQDFSVVAVWLDTYLNLKVQLADFSKPLTKIQYDELVKTKKLEELEFVRNIAQTIENLFSQHHLGSFSLINSSPNVHLLEFIKHYPINMEWQNLVLYSLEPEVARVALLAFIVHVTNSKSLLNDLIEPVSSSNSGRAIEVADVSQSIDYNDESSVTTLIDFVEDPNGLNDYTVKWILNRIALDISSNQELSKKLSRLSKRELIDTVNEFFRIVTGEVEISQTSNKNSELMASLLSTNSLFTLAQKSLTAPEEKSEFREGTSLSPKIVEQSEISNIKAKQIKQNDGDSDIDFSSLDKQQKIEWLADSYLLSDEQVGLIRNLQEERLISLNSAIQDYIESDIIPNDSEIHQLLIKLFSNSEDKTRDNPQESDANLRQISGTNQEKKVETNVELTKEVSKDEFNIQILYDHFNVNLPSAVITIKDNSLLRIGRGIFLLSEKRESALTFLELATKLAAKISYLKNETFLSNALLSLIKSELLEVCNNQEVNMIFNAINFKKDDPQLKSLITNIGDYDGLKKEVFSGKEALKLISLQFGDKTLSLYDIFQ